MQSNTIIHFTYAPGSGPKTEKLLPPDDSKVVKGAPSRHYTPASLYPKNDQGIHAVHYTRTPKVDEHNIKKLTSEPEPKLNPVNDTEKAEINSDVAAPSLLDMSIELKAKVAFLPEHWFDQGFCNDALTRFMRHSTVTDDYNCEIDSATCLANADKLLSLNAVANDETQTAIDKLVEKFLQQDHFTEATNYEHIWAAAKCPLKSMKVTALLHEINRNLFDCDTYTFDYINRIQVDQVSPLRTMLRIPGITLAPNQQSLLDMAYIKAKHDGPAELARALLELGGRDGGEMIALTVERKIEELQTSLKRLQQGVDELHDRFDTLENRKNCRSVCIIL